jgi:putative FmdB family regulatory protein
MPFYSYLCAECGPFDEIRSISSYEEPEPCPLCGEPAPRQLGAPMIRRVGGDASASALAARTLRHRAGCGCCASGAQRPSTAEAVAAAKPRRSRKAAPAGSFLTRA